MLQIFLEFSEGHKGKYEDNEEWNESMKTMQTELLYEKYIWNKMKLKNTLNMISSWLDTAEKKIKEHEDRATETIKWSIVEKKKDWRKKTRASVEYYLDN